MLKEFQCYGVSGILPVRIRECFENMSEIQIKNTSEIRIRKDKPVMFYGSYGAMFALPGGASGIYSDRCITAGESDISSILAKASGYSIYSHFDELSNGFMTVSGGHRIGVGAAAVDGGASFKDVESLNIRLSRPHFRCADHICSEIFSDGLCGFLIAGPPGSGKTTILRDIAVTLSNNPKYGYPRVVIADERFELSEGVENEKLMCCDVIKGYPKKRAFEMALRSLCPDIVISDELSFDDAEYVDKMLSCGVFAGMSVHASNIKELREKDGIGELIKGGKIKNIVILEGKNAPGRVKEIIREG